MKIRGARLTDSDRESRTIPRTSAVGEEYRVALQALVGRAVSSLQNARQDEGLQDASARVALAWIRIGNATLLHDVRPYIGMIYNELYLLKNAFAQGQAQGPVFSSHLAAVEEAVEELASSLWRLSDHSEEWDTISSIRINDSLILNRAEQIKGRRLEDVPLRRCCELEGDATIRANAYWLNRVIDILLSNAVKATEGQDEREIWLKSKALEGRAEIYVEDNGIEFPEELCAEISHGRVPHSRNRRLGVGLVLANAMVQAYGGRIRCVRRDPRGTAMVISLPLEGSRRDEAEDFVRRQ